MKKGFTLIEALIVVGIIIGIFLTYKIFTADWGNEKLVCDQNQIKSRLSYGRSNPSYVCLGKEEYNDRIRYNCKKNAKDMVDGTMSDTWGNDEYNTEPPAILMEKVYFDCLNKELK